MRKPPQPSRPSGRRPTPPRRTPTRPQTSARPQTPAPRPPAPPARPERKEKAAPAPSEIKSIPAAISTARAGRSTPDPTAERVVRSAERFAERAKLRRRVLLRKYLIGGGILAVVAAGLWLVFLSGVFDLRANEIKIVGAGEFVSDAEVVAVLDSDVGQPLARLDLDDIAERVEEVRGVSSAIVRREWPHGVRVSLAQRVPVAAVKSQDAYVLLDADGVRVGESDAAPEDLALAKVPLSQGRESSLAAVLTVLDEIPDDLRAEIVDIGADTRDAVYFTLEEGVRVEWGSADDSALKANVLEVLREQKASIYDVSAPTLPVTRE